jgi:lipopolysaccharide biosynthesis protein
VLPELRHQDYLRIHGRPVLAVYRPAQIPQPARVVESWRETARRSGVGELYLLAVDVPGAFDGLDGSARAHGFDGLMGFAPHNIKWTWRDASELGARPGFAGNIFDYGELVRDALRKVGQPHSDEYFPGVMTGFDNTARRAATPDLWYGANPYTFHRWLAGAVEAVQDRPWEDRVVFINAWNEWAEGAMLEPSDKFGLTYLQAVRDVLL